jgi:hypothetical protein
VNFKKFMLLIAAAVVLLAGYELLTHVNRKDPVAVATAFAKALKHKDTSSASKYYLPDKAAAWREKTDSDVDGMRSGTMERFFERIPDAPAFSSPVTVAGKTVITSADKNYRLEMTQIDGKWYVSNSDL